MSGNQLLNGLYGSVIMKQWNCCQMTFEVEVPSDVQYVLCFSYRLQKLMHSAHPGLLNVSHSNLVLSRNLINKPWLSVESELHTLGALFQHLAVVLCTYSTHSEYFITKKLPTGKKSECNCIFSFSPQSVVDSAQCILTCIQCNYITALLWSIITHLLMCYIVLFSLCCKQIVLRATPLWLFCLTLYCICVLFDQIVSFHLIHYTVILLANHLTCLRIKSTENIIRKGKWIKGIVTAILCKRGSKVIDQYHASDQTLHCLLHNNVWPCSQITSGILCFDWTDLCCTHT